MHEFYIFTGNPDIDKIIRLPFCPRVGEQIVVTCGEADRLYKVTNVRYVAKDSTSLSVVLYVSFLEFV